MQRVRVTSLAPGHATHRRSAFEAGLCGRPSDGGARDVAPPMAARTARCADAERLLLHYRLESLLDHGGYRLERALFYTEHSA